MVSTYAIILHLIYFQHKPYLIRKKKIFNNIPLGGGVTENFEFEMGTDTEVYDSCSAILNGETFIFGGGKEKKQVFASAHIYYSSLI